MDYTLTQLFKTLLDQGGSDLHIATGSPPRIRIDGHLVPLQLPPLLPQETLELCYTILTEEQKKVFEKQKEIDLAFSIKKLARFRANIFFDRGTVAAAFRIIPDQLFKMEQLGLPQVAYDICDLPRGLVLVTGPTGSGKSTTLASMINHINETRYDHIVTIEDPVEFLHPHKRCVVNQRELGEDTESFQRALKSILRQDPDIVLIGELRDLETITAALTIAETGHLVFGTLHTNSCVSTLNRIIDAFPPYQQNQVRNQLSMTLEAVFSQLLIPSQKGGRVLAIEVMRVNTSIRALIHEGKFNQIYSAMQAGQSESYMQTMNQCLARHCAMGLISKDAALAKSGQKDELQDMLLKKSVSSMQQKKPIK